MNNIPELARAYHDARATLKEARAALERSLIAACPYAPGDIVKNEYGQLALVSEVVASDYFEDQIYVLPRGRLLKKTGEPGERATSYYDWKTATLHEKRGAA